MTMRNRAAVWALSLAFTVLAVSGPLTCWLARRNSQGLIRATGAATWLFRQHYLDSALLAASAQGVYENVVWLIGAGANPNAQNGAGKAALALSLGPHGSSAIALLLLEKGAEPNSHDANGVTPLMEACSWQQTEVVERLLRLGADVNALDRRGANVLYYVARGSADETGRLLRLLFAAGARHQISPELGWDPLERFTEAGVAVPWASSGGNRSEPNSGAERAREPQAH